MGKNLDLQDLDSQDLDIQTKALCMAFESSQARMERVNFKLWIVILVLIVTLIGTNAGWIWYENQFEDVVTNTETITQDLDASDGGDAIIYDGVHINGESKTDGDKNPNQK